MATAKPNPHASPRRRGRIWLIAAAIVAVLVALFWQPVAGYAKVGAAYGARVACSCRFVAGRGLEDCEKDFEPGMELISLSEDAEAKSVTARFALVHAETATYREGEGCVLEAWRD
ncbi:MAG: hypothetical protein ACREBO_13625 [Novosphingobium sp.]